MEWKISSRPVPYEQALAFMEARVAAIRAGEAEECVWLLEHPPLYTAGTSAKEEDLVDASNFPVFETGRGGQYTYHGPGQRVAYIMLDLKKRSDAPDIRTFVKQLENLIIQTLARFDVRGFTAEGRIGVWVEEESSEFSQNSTNSQGVSADTRLQSAQPLGLSRSAVARSGSTQKKQSKIAALGIRVRHWVTFHGISINVNPDLAHFSGIIPCGISPQEYGVTSLAALGKGMSMAQLDAALKEEFGKVFG